MVLNIATHFEYGSLPQEAIEYTLRLNIEQIMLAKSDHVNKQPYSMGNEVVDTPFL